LNSPVPRQRGVLDSPSPAERTVKRLLLDPLVNCIIPASVLRSIVRTSPLGAESMARPGGWRALELCYRNGSHANVIDRLVSKGAFFPRAARNRRVLAVAALGRCIGEVAGGGLVVSLGSGPGRCEMEAMRAAGGDGVRLLCIERDRAAFECGRELCRRLGLEGRVSFVEGDVETLAGMRESCADIVSMLGFLGYFEDAALASLLAAVFRVLKPGGAILTNSITDAHGVDGFMERVFGWSHHYRAPSVVRSFLEGAGLVNIEEVPEPFGVYSILTGRRP
jgi:ubiquinone/menaquinone biosynthesis C-methylase UbiE